MKNLFRRWTRLHEKEIDEEIRHHLQLETRDREERGLSAEEASYAAMRSFGNKLLVKETTTAMWRVNPLTGLSRDFSQALRTLRHTRGSTALAIVTLAVGIAVNTAIFSVVHYVLIKPLPFPEPDRLVWINEVAADGQVKSNSYPNFKDWRERARSFSGMASVARAPMPLTGISDAAQLTGRIASAEFLELLGVQPTLGRLFTKAEDRPGASPVVILSHSAWQNYFGADPGMIGRNVRLDEKLRTVIGILPATFSYYRGSEDFYVPLSSVEEQPDGYTNRGNHFGLQTIARLRPGVEPAQALAEMQSIERELAQQYPDVNSGQSIRIQPFTESVRARLRPLLLILFASVALVFLIACVNVANLLLARVITRQREITVRSALGASRARIMRLLMCESFLLAGAAGALGSVGAAVIVVLIRPIIPVNYGIMSEAEVSIPALLFALAASTAAALLFGLMPAFHASGMNLQAGLNGSGRSGTGSRSASGFRRALLVSEVGLAVVLASASMLLIRSLRNAMSADLGFEPERLLTAEIRLPENRYDGPGSIRFIDRLQPELETIPGVTGATTVMCLPVDGSCWGSVLEIGGKPQPDRAHWPRVQFNVAGPDYFRVMGIPLRAGRVFSAVDTPNATNVAVLNDTAARKLFGNDDPIGKWIRQGWPENNTPWRRIVGIVADVRQNGPTAERTPEIFFPHTQQDGALMWPVLRANVNPDSLASALRDIVRRLDPDIPVHNIKTMDMRLEDSFAARRFTLLLISAFSAIALVMAAVGLFGAITYAVQQRTREIAIRMAVGAIPRKILAGVLREGFGLCALGVLLGILCSAATMQFIRTLLFGVESFDPLSVGIVAAGVIALGLAATGLPAWRAAKVDPLVSLRHE